MGSRLSNRRVRKSSSRNNDVEHRTSLHKGSTGTLNPLDDIPESAQTTYQKPADLACDEPVYSLPERNEPIYETTSQAACSSNPVDVAVLSQSQPSGHAAHPGKDNVVLSTAVRENLSTAVGVADYNKLWTPASPTTHLKEVYHSSVGSRYSSRALPELPSRVLPHSCVKFNPEGTACSRTDLKPVIESHRYQQAVSFSQPSSEDDLDDDDDYCRGHQYENKPAHVVSRDLLTSWFTTRGQAEEHTYSAPHREATPSGTSNAEREEKVIKCLVFARFTQILKQGVMKITLAFVDKESDQEEVNGQLKSLGCERLLYQEHHFLYSNVSENVSVQIDGLGEDWQIHGHPNDKSLIKVLQFKKLWHGLLQTCTFDFITRVSRDPQAFCLTCWIQQDSLRDEKTTIDFYEAILQIPDGLAIPGSKGLHGMLNYEKIQDTTHRSSASSEIGSYTVISNEDGQESVTSA